MPTTEPETERPSTLLAPPERVLSTLNSDGSRRWLRPRPSPGRFLAWRRIVGYLLIALFAALPHLRIAGKPAILLDLPRREFTILGTTFLPTDTLLLALLLVAVFLAIFLVTALLGRLWCGWGCPQTVYLELVYRPIQRLWEGAHYRSAGKGDLAGWRRAGKLATFLVVSFVIAHVFLSYFVGWDELTRWMRGSPFEHPTSFAIVMAVTGLMMLDFAFLREQVCTIMCPYGRFQSVLLDRRSLIISYDPRRGEPRGKRRKGAAAPQGDCVDCGLCVATCPTGIDIRDGLQMECIGCAQCIDACDTVMDRIGTPRGLIRYSSQEAIETGKVRLIRPRVIIYPLVLAVVLALFAGVLASREPLKVSFLRLRTTPYALLDDGRVRTQVEVKLLNRLDAPASWTIRAVEPGYDLSGADGAVMLEPLGFRTVVLQLVVPRDRFERGRAPLTLELADGTGRVQIAEHHVAGPLFGGAAAPSVPPTPEGTP